MTSLPEHSWCSRASQPSRLEPCPRYVQVLGPAYHLLNVEVLPFDSQDIESDICLLMCIDKGMKLSYLPQAQIDNCSAKTNLKASESCLSHCLLPLPFMLLFELPAGSGFQKPGCFWKMDLRLAPD